MRKKLLLAAAAFIAAALIIIRVLPYDITGGTAFSAEIKDRNGTAMRIFLTGDDSFRIWRPLEAFPEHLTDAVLLKEDRTFRMHPGVNPAALFRAVYHTYLKKDRRIGASTISMQLAKMRTGMETGTPAGKLRQIASALRLEIKYSKDRILEAYMNLVPCGGNIYGFPAAAEIYFGKDISGLSLSESLYLAVLPQDPNGRAPFRGSVPAEGLEARAVLYREWTKTHETDPAAETAVLLPPGLSGGLPFTAPHYCEYVRSLLPEDRTVISTMDPGMQQLSEAALESYLNAVSSLGVKNGAVLLLDYTSMEVLAAVGSADFFNNGISGQVNGFTARRSPGSTLKPFVYAMAIEQGLIHPSTMVKDSPTSFGVYTPDNYKSEFSGPVPAWEALVNSRNIPAVRLASGLKNDGLYGFLRSCGTEGLKEPEHYGLSIVLGSAEVSMIELAEMYAALANGGEHRKAAFIVNGGPSAKTRVLDKRAAWLCLDMLKKNPPPPGARPAECAAVPVAYKTGTSIGFRDCWSAAVFDRYVLCVWLGNFDGTGNTAFLGRTLAAPLLFTIADAVISRIPAEKRLQPAGPPEGITTVKVCAVSGAIPNGYCPETTDTYFIPGVSPIKTCGVHREIFVDRRTGLRSRTENEWTEKQIREFWSSDLLELFREAGLPRLVPPPYPSEYTGQEQAGSPSGSPPVILSPLSGAVYVLRPQTPEKNSIVLSAAADSGSEEIFWFAGSSFIGRTKAGSRMEWRPEPGNYRLTAVDSAGRSSSSVFSVEKEIR